MPPYLAAAQTTLEHVDAEVLAAAVGVVGNAETATCRPERVCIGLGAAAVTSSVVELAMR